MTTDVINDVPRSLLAAFAAGADKYDDSTLCVIHDGCELWQIGHARAAITVGHLRAIRALLATAQPADHSEHALNMAAQPAADGGREAYPHGHRLHKEVFMALECFQGDDTFETGVRRLIEELKQARAAQPKQTVAVQVGRCACGSTEPHNMTLGCIKAAGDAGRNTEAVAVTDEVGRLREALTEMRDTMQRYFPGENPEAHKALMQRAEAAISGEKNE